MKSSAWLKIKKLNALFLINIFFRYYLQIKLCKNAAVKYRLNYIFSINVLQVSFVKNKVRLLIFLQPTTFLSKAEIYRLFKLNWIKFVSFNVYLEQYPTIFYYEWNEKVNWNNFVPSGWLLYFSEKEFFSVLNFKSKDYFDGHDT